MNTNLFKCLCHVGCSDFGIESYETRGNDWTKKNHFVKFETCVHFVFYDPAVIYTLPNKSKSLAVGTRQAVAQQRKLIKLNVKRIVCYFLVLYSAAT